MSEYQTIEDIAANLDDGCSLARERMGSNESLVAQLFDPLKQCGFTKFSVVGEGSSSLVLKPEGNEEIVFRVSVETKDYFRRLNKIPFFLAAAYEKVAGEAPIRDLKLEVLLKGNPITETNNTGETPEMNFLFEQMMIAGWQLQYMHDDNNRLWSDVVTITLRGADGRTKTVPIVSDPSALRYYFRGVWANHNPLNPTNICGPDYITMQDQANAYNAARMRDDRLLRLIPEPVQFPETRIIAPERDERGMPR